VHQPIRQGRSWGRRFRRREWLDRSWLVVPSLYVLAALALGKAVPALETGNEVDPLGLALSTDSAREILNAVAGGMIAFTGLVVSVAVVVVQFGAGQYTPRLVLRFRRDLVVKHALGIFIAPALYALVALGELGAPGGDLQPNLTVGLAVVLLVVAVFAFFGLVARLLDLLRPRRLFEQLLRGCERAIDEVYPVPFTGAASPPPASAPVTLTVAHDGKEGVVSALDRPRLMAIAVETGAVLEVAAAVGEFLRRGAPLVRVRGGRGISADDVERAVIVSDERTLVQDPAFAIRAIVDIVIRALSPAVNDPTTASQGLDVLESLLHRLAARELGAGRLLDEEGTMRVVYRAPGWDELLALALTEVRHYGAPAHQVARRMRALLDGLVEVVPEQRAGAVHAQLALLDAAVRSAFPDPSERAVALEPDPMGLGGPR